MSQTALRRVTARKNHRCNACDKLNIKPGEAYLASTVFPNSELGNKVPLRFKECGFCAERYDRDYLLEPMPEVQGHMVYINAMQQGRG